MILKNFFMKWLRHTFEKHGLKLGRLILLHNSVKKHLLNWWGWQKISFKKLHPAIHIIHAVTSHAEKEFTTLTRGKKHTVPQRELDICTLQNSYHASCIFQFTPGRGKPSNSDYAADVFLEGAHSLHTGKFLKTGLMDGHTNVQPPKRNLEMRGLVVSLILLEKRCQSKNLQRM